jgi:CubicO group peptidase (beta-lactamase class C family)
LDQGDCKAEEITMKLGHDSGGFDPGRLRRIDQFLEARYVAPGKLPCAAILVGYEDEIVHSAALGSQRIGGPDLKTDALFRIASMTKPLTSIAFMMLFEQGLVALDDPVDLVLPEWAAIGVYAGGGGAAPFVTKRPQQRMRMIDLMRHTSGLTYGFQNRTNVDAAYRSGKVDPFTREMTPDSFVAALAKMPLEFEPGSAWNYSVSTDVLGIIVERLSKQSLGRFFADHIFAPLGMVDTFFQVPEDKKHRLTDAFVLGPDGKPIAADLAEKSFWLRTPSMESGGGGLVSTLADYHRFCRMLLRGGELDGVRIVSPKTLELMTANHLPGNVDLTVLSRSLFSEASNAGTGFGLGFATVINAAHTLMPGTVGEFFWGGMYSTFFFVDPVERITMVFMTQLMPSTIYPIRRELRTLIYSALTKSRTWPR